MPLPFLLTVILVAPLGQAWDVDDEQVDAAIAAGQKALLERISDLDEITYRPARVGMVQTVRGRVTRRLGPVVLLVTTSGATLRIPRESITHWVTAGHVHPELTSHFYGGPSALVALALVNSGVDTQNPALAMLLEALAQDDIQKAGTYVRGLRSSLWSAVLARPLGKESRARYKKLATAEIAGLVKSMQAGGGFSYTPGMEGTWDNSNSQFGHLGLWAGAVAGVEVSSRTWQAVARHWRESQSPAGGWGYSEGGDIPTSSMTVAGCNSLHIVLDQHYARLDQPYVWFKGARPNRKVREEIRRLQQALVRGDQFLEVRPPNPESFFGYELFGLERLGLAGGQAIIGGKDWFREHVGGVVRREWGRDAVADAFALIFLVHGLAPIVFQKLEHGEATEDWNYYHRDLSGLCRYLTRSFERLHRWQRMPEEAGLRDLHDAPILYISGRERLSLSTDTRRRLRRYIEEGGTVFLHADLAGPAFVKSATALFENMFRDLDLRFQPVESDHAVYTCRFDCRGRKGQQRVPLQALADGPRVYVWLCPVDIAGAWHQHRLGRHEVLYQLMANIRVYSAPPCAKLPSRLRAAPTLASAVAPRGAAALRRLPYAGAWNAHPGAWQRYARGLRSRTGLDLAISDDTDLPSAKAMRRYDLVHLTARERIAITDRSLSHLDTYLKSGGLLLIDAADGQPAGVSAVSDFVGSLRIGELGSLSSDHPIITGVMPGGRRLEALEATKAGASLVRGDGAPPIYTRVLDGRVVVLACPFDLLAGMDGHFVWNCSGYEPESTARLVDNILLWRFADATSRPTEKP